MDTSRRPSRHSTLPIREQRLCYDQPASAAAPEVLPPQYRGNEALMQQYLALQDLAENLRTEQERDRRLQAALDFAKAEREKLGERLIVARGIERQLTAQKQSVETEIRSPTLNDIQRQTKQQILTVLQPRLVDVLAIRQMLEEREKKGDWWANTKGWAGHQLDVSQWSPTKKAVLATAGVGLAALLGYWAYRKIRGGGGGGAEGKEKKGGVPKWLLWIPGIGLGALALYGAAKYLKDAKWVPEWLRDAANTAEDLGNKAKDAGEVAAGGLHRGAEKVAENAQAFQNLGGRAWEIWKKRETYRDQLDFYADFFPALLIQTPVIATKTALYLGASGKDIVVNSGEIAGAFVEWVGTGKANWKEMGKVYVETSLIYLASFGVIDMALWSRALGIKGAARLTGQRAALWPYELYRKSGAKMTLGCLIPGRAGVINRVELMARVHSPVYMFHRIADKFGSWSPKYLENLLQEYKMWDRMIDRVKGYRGTEDLRGLLTHKRNMIRNQIGNGLVALHGKGGEARLPQYVKEITQNDEMLRQIARNQVDIEELDQMLTKASIEEQPGVFARGWEQVRQYCKEKFSRTGGVSGVADEAVDAAAGTRISQIEDAVRGGALTLDDAAKQLRGLGQSLEGTAEVIANVADDAGEMAKALHGAGWTNLEDIGKVMRGSGFMEVFATEEDFLEHVCRRLGVRASNEVRSLAKGCNLSESLHIDDVVRRLSTPPTGGAVVIPHSPPRLGSPTPAAAEGAASSSARATATAVDAADEVDEATRLTRAKQVLNLRVAEELTDVQRGAILRAHAVPSTLEAGQVGYQGSRFTRHDLARKIQILREEGGFTQNQWKALFREGVCGDDIATIAARIDEAEIMRGVAVVSGTAVVSAVAKAERNLEELGKARMADLLGELAKDGVSAARAEELLKGAGRIDPDTLIQIMSSGRGRKFLAGACKLSDAEGAAEEVARALKAAKLARNVRLGMNVAGAAGDVFGIAMAAYDWYANGQRIKETKNPALKDLYAGAYPLYLAEGGTSAAGLVLGGIAVVSAYKAGATLATALAAPGALVMLPLAAAVIGARYYYKAVEEAAEGWLKEAGDWEKEDNGEILKRITDLKVGSSTFGQRIGAADWKDHVRPSLTMREVTFERLQSANASQCAELYRAYFRKNTILPRQPREDERAYHDRFNRFICDELIYIDRMTGGTFAKVFNWQLEAASSYAELAARARRLQWREQDGEEITETEWKVTATLDDGSKQDLDIREFGKDQSPAKTIQMTELYRRAVTEQQEFQQLALHANQLTKGFEAAGEAREGIRSMLLTRFRHRINAYEAKIRAADYDNFSLGFFSLHIDLSDKHEKNSIRAYINRMIDAHVDRAVHAICRAATNPDAIFSGDVPKEYGDAMHQIVSLLDTDPVQIFRRKSLGEGHGKPNDRTLIDMVPGAAMQDQMIAAHGRAS